MLSEAAQSEIREIIQRYPVKRSAILPALWVAQRECGYLTEEAMRSVGKLLELNTTQVYEVATFYTMFHLKSPGKYVLQVCRTLPCALSGAFDILRHLKDRLEIDVGETTADGLFTLKTAECLASCGTAPMMLVNEDYYENLTLQKVDRVLKDLAEQGRCSLASGPFISPALNNPPHNGREAASNTLKE